MQWILMDNVTNEILGEIVGDMSTFPKLYQDKK